MFFLLLIYGLSPFLFRIKLESAEEMQQGIKNIKVQCRSPNIVLPVGDMNVYLPVQSTNQHKLKQITEICTVCTCNFECLLPPHLAENQSGLLHLCSFHLTQEMEYEDP